ncbi:MAG: saccharopine dehydrogenase [Bacteroidetes bacterium]|nr:MAG: saccharopine dehydrogenase [Bacteroidota bacterium]
MKKITVLGAGRVGNAIARDLAERYEVTAVDAHETALERLRPHMGVRRADLSNASELRAAIQDADLVIGALPGFMGFQALQTILEAEKNVVDISFFPEDPFLLDESAESRGCTAVVDCGVAPGMDNLILGHHHRSMKVERFRCLVGGLPRVREWPWEYRAVFSPIDVIEEYVRPARYREGGRLVTREALSDPELIDFPGLGTLEAFNTDGLRTLLHTMPDVPDMIEKTLRYPGCIEYLRVLRSGGFFSYEEIEVDGKRVRPIDVTAKLLFPKWQLRPGESDFTVMRVIVEGRENDRPVRYTYDLLDEYDHETDTLSMARTTGYTCTAVAELVLSGAFRRTGICPPEYVGEAGLLDRVLEYLRRRGVEYQVQCSSWQ